MNRSTQVEKEVQLVIEAMFQHGLVLGGFEKSFLLNSIEKRVKSAQTISIGDYANLVSKSTDEAQLLFKSLDIHYSKFYRNPFSYAILENIILPKLHTNKKNRTSKEIRIWSAACASGQEPYSLAILLEELKQSMGYDLKYRVFATDHSEYQIHQAIRGEYFYDEINHLSMKQFKRWFTKIESKYMVDKSLQKHLDFSVFDLLNEKNSCPTNSIFGEFDLVICSNLLFYYNSDNKKIILNKVQNCLAKNGYLMCGETERELLLNHGLHETIQHSSIFTARSNTY